MLPMQRMNKSTLLLVPSGGLANCMRAIVSAYHLCQLSDSHLQVVWFQGWGMHAAYSDVFEPLTKGNVAVREANVWDYIVNDRPRRHNLWLPYLPQQLYYCGGVIGELQIADFQQQGFDFARWLRGHRRYMSCHFEVVTPPRSLYRDFYVPTAPVRALVAEYQQQFAAYTIGMHIRRTDNIDSINRSPIEQFIETGRKELADHPDAKVFLATDSEDVKKEMRQHFGDHIITSSAEATRDSVAGIRAGLAEMWTLSLTHKIYGSAGSSFSEMASWIGGNELQILER